MSMLNGLMVVGLAGAISMVVSGCASGPAEPSYEEHEVVHTATAEEARVATARESLTGDDAKLYINGMSCPLCATNIDLQLLKVRGVTDVAVDFSTGTALVRFGGSDRPSGAELAHAVAEAGFKLIKIESPARDTTSGVKGGAK
ncbi:MAG: heavy-metal-associated domain-containing protein [Phycisphaerales bacterium]